MCEERGREREIFLIHMYIHLYRVYQLYDKWTHTHIHMHTHTPGAYPGFEKGGCLRTVVVSIYRARFFFRTARVPRGYYC